MPKLHFSFNSDDIHIPCFCFFFVYVFGGEEVAAVGAEYTHICIYNI